MAAPVPSCNTRCDTNRKLELGRLAQVTLYYYYYYYCKGTDSFGPAIFPPGWAREARRVWPGAALVAAHRVHVASSGCWR